MLRFPDETDLYVPLALTPQERTTPGNFGYAVIARLLGRPRPRAVLNVLLEAGEPVPVARIRHESGVEAPVVSDALRGMAQLGLVRRTGGPGEEPSWVATDDAAARLDPAGEWGGG